MQVKPTNQDLQKQHLDFVLPDIFFPAKKSHRNTGGERKERGEKYPQTTSFKDSHQVFKPLNCATVKSNTLRQSRGYCILKMPFFVFLGILKIVIMKMYFFHIFHPTLFPLLCFIWMKYYNCKTWHLFSFININTFLDTLTCTKCLWR